jgi:P4 family phage/plasmid primase-like protien
MINNTTNSMNPSKISKILSEYNSILDEARLPPGQKTEITHVSMGGNRGKFSFDKSLRKRLIKIVANAVSNGIDLHIAEMPRDFGPIIFDIDLDKKKEDYNSEINNGRLYDDDMIVEVVEYYREAIKHYLDVSDNQLKVCIMEKKGVNIKDNFVRDGIHGFFHEICTSAKVRHLIRNYVVNKANESQTFEGFNKKVNEIFDKAIISSAPWLMYGCKKPEGNAYRLTKVLDSLFNDYGPESLGDVYQITKVFSIQQKVWCEENASPYSNNHTNESIEKECEKFGLIRQKVIIEQSEDLPENKKDQIEKAKALVNMLKDERADIHIEWMRVGWALHNIDKSLLQEWIEFSQRSDKYKEGECEEKWLGMKNGGYTISSLIYWARTDSPEEFKKYMVQTYDFFIKRSLDTNTYYIAKALHNKFSERFVCVSLGKNIWYEFKNHKWVLSEGGTGLINLICTEFINDFHQLVINYNQKALQMHGSEKEDFQNKASKTQKIIDRLLNITFKKQIMEEAKNLFYDNEFLKKLDEINKNLIAFENGIYDLEKEEFRIGRADDFISLSTKVNYIKWDVNKPEIKKYKDKIDTYFNQVLPNPEKRKYFLLSLASSCSGENKDQRFRTITGSGSVNNGSNGKSLTMSLVAKSLGEYYSACPITIITRKRGEAGQASPELARLKGVRMMVFSESDESDSLNVGIIKELTGNDRFMVRPLYCEPFEMQIQAKPWLQCNKLPIIKATDRGTWRRIKVIEFDSVFVDNPDPKKNNEFKLNPNLEYEIDDWAPYFMSYLIDLYVNEYKKEAHLTEPDCVQAFTDKYKSESNSVLRFITEVIEVDSKHPKYTSLATCWEKYRDWIREQADDSLKALSKADFDKSVPEHMPVPFNKTKNGFKNIKFIKIVNNNDGDESDDDKKNNLDL